MDANLVLIFSFILVISTLAFAMAHKFHQRTVVHEERKLELKAQIEQAKAQQVTAGNADYRKFEDRLRVLERIATDSNHMLASQIDELRSLDAIEDRTGGREKSL